MEKKQKKHLFFFSFEDFIKIQKKYKKTKIKFFGSIRNLAYDVINNRSSQLRTNVVFFGHFFAKKIKNHKILINLQKLKISK